MRDDNGRTLRFKVQPTGGWALAHPQSRGPHVLTVENVPEDIPTSQAIRRVNAATGLQPNRTVDYAELNPRS
jgi:hypothetical protein